MAKINVRSPYFINLATTNLTTAKLELKIYTGVASTTFQGSIQYTLNSTAVNAKVNFEISELVKDYIQTEFNGSFPSTPVALAESTTVFVDYKTTETLSSGSPVVTTVLAVRGFYGYGYFENGVNPQLSDARLESNSSILKNTNSTVTIAVDNTIATSLEWKYQGAVVSTISLPAQAKIEDQITYVTNTGNFNVDQAVIGVGASKTETISITSFEKCKFIPYKLIFINKYGAYQEIWMFGNSRLSMNTTEEKYKSNILTNGTYNTYDPQIKLLTKNANQSLTLNSDYYPESYNEIFRQLFLSEKVWILYNSQTLGVNIQSKQLTYKTSLTDSLINYTVDVNFAFDTINNIR